MREIRFRAKRKADGEWVEGFYYESKISGCYILVPKFKIRKKDGVVISDTFKVYEVIPETVGQYTGLTDKNGVKIFEGDIVDILTENEEIGVVAYDDGGFLVNADGFCVDFINNINGTDVEVIGNIHDNPELRGVGE